MMFAQYFEYYGIILGGPFFRGHTVYAVGWCLVAELWHAWRGCTCIFHETVSWTRYVNRMH